MLSLSTFCKKLVSGGVSGLQKIKYFTEYSYVYPLTLSTFKGPNSFKILNGRLEFEQDNLESDQRRECEAPFPI